MATIAANVGCRTTLQKARRVLLATCARQTAPSNRWPGVGDRRWCRRHPLVTCRLRPSQHHRRGAEAEGRVGRPEQRQRHSHPHEAVLEQEPVEPWDPPAPLLHHRPVAREEAERLPAKRVEERGEAPAVQVGQQGAREELHHQEHQPLRIDREEATGERADREEDRTRQEQRGEDEERVLRHVRKERGWRERRASRPRHQGAEQEPDRQADMHQRHDREGAQEAPAEVVRVS